MELPGQGSPAQEHKPLTPHLLSGLRTVSPSAGKLQGGDIDGKEDCNCREKPLGALGGWLI